METQKYVHLVLLTCVCPCTQHAYRKLCHGNWTVHVLWHCWAILCCFQQHKRICLHVKCPIFLSYFNESVFCRHIFVEVPSIEIHENPSSGSRADNAGTDEHDEANRRFSQYANEPKINVMMIMNSLWCVVSALRVWLITLHWKRNRKIKFKPFLWNTLNWYSSLKWFVLFTKYYRMSQSSGFVFSRLGSNLCPGRTTLIEVFLHFLSPQGKWRGSTTFSNSLLYSLTAVIRRHICIITNRKRN
jgi:hypothetical protein